MEADMNGPYKLSKLWIQVIPICIGAGAGYSLQAVGRTLMVKWFLRLAPEPHTANWEDWLFILTTRLVPIGALVSSAAACLMTYRFLARQNTKQRRGFEICDASEQESESQGRM